MKKTTILLTLLCASVLNGMEPEHGQLTCLETLPPEVIILTLNTYDNLNNIIYAIKVMSMTSKMFMQIIDDKYGDPEKLEIFALALYDRFVTKPCKLLQDYQAAHAQDYKAMNKWCKYAHKYAPLHPDCFTADKETWYTNLSLVEKEAHCLYSDYQKGLLIKNSEPKVLYFSTPIIVGMFKTPAAKKYAQNLVSKELLRSNNFDNIKRLINKGANVNYSNDKGITPLLRALCNGSPIKMIQLLLTSGANPHAIDKENKGVFEYLDIGYPQTFEVYRIQKQKIQKLLEEALEKHTSSL